MLFAAAGTGSDIDVVDVIYAVGVDAVDVHADVHAVQRIGGGGEDVSTPGPDSCTCLEGKTLLVCRRRQSMQLHTTN